MKRAPFMTVIAVLSLLILSFKVADSIAEKLGISSGALQNSIMGNLTGDFNTTIESYKQSEADMFKIPYTKMLPSIAAGDKAGAAKELCDYVKLYCNSQAFLDEYNKRRMAALPLSDNGTTVGYLMQNIDVCKTNIANYKNDTKYVAEQQTKLDDAQKRLNALLEKAKQPFPLKEEWEKTYPADPAVQIKGRLQEYISLVSTIDFNAQLTAPDNHNKRHFTNPAYEKKSLKWKAIYRAGKEVNDVATAWAKDWLKGDILSKEKTTLPDEKKATATTSGAATNTNVSGAITNNQNNNSSTTAPAASAPKDKKSLLKKLTNKTKDIINQ